MRDAYHPDTLEHIQTDTPADWMGLAGAPAPAYNPATEGCFWRNGAWVVIAAGTQPPQDDARQSALASTYADVDAIYAAAIGNRKTEYEEAEQAAIAFQAAGYTGTASPYVADYAATAGITDRQSADLIIARANGLRAAVLAMRSSRFTAQAAMRAATTQAELDAAVAAWAAFIAQVRTSLGLPSAQRRC